MSVSRRDTLRPVLPYTAAAKRPLRERSECIAHVRQRNTILKRGRNRVQTPSA